MQEQWNELLSHPYVTTPIAFGAAINPWIVEGMPILLQIAGILFICIQVYYIIKNKGKK